MQSFEAGYRTSTKPAITLRRWWIWRVIIVCLLLLIGTYYWLARDTEPRAVIAWEFSPPAGEQWLVSATMPQTAWDTIGMGLERRTSWIDFSGHALSPQSSLPQEYLSFVWLVDAPGYQRDYVDSHGQKCIEVQNAASQQRWEIKLADYPGFEGIKITQVPPFYPGRDGAMYLQYGDRDVLTCQPDGSQLRHLSLELPVKQLITARSDGTLLCTVGDTEDVALFNAAGQLLWRTLEELRDYTVLTAEDPDGGVTLTTKSSRVKLAANGSVLWSREIPLNPAPPLRQYPGIHERNFTCPDGSIIHNYGDVIAGYNSGSDSTWEMDLYRELGLQVNYVASGEPHNGVIVVLSKPDLGLAWNNLLRSLTQAPPVRLDTHLAFISSAGETTRLCRLIPGQYFPTCVGPDGEVYCTRLADPMHAVYDNQTFCRLELPR